MPATASLQLWAGVGYAGFWWQGYGAGDCSTYPGAGGNSDLGVTYTWVDAAVQMLDNRFSLGTSNVFAGTGNFPTYTSILGPLLSGTTAHVPGILSGAKLTSMQINYTGGLSSAGTQFLNFATNFSTKGWGSTLFNYLCDEPPLRGSCATLLAHGTLIQGVS